MVGSQATRVLKEIEKEEELVSREKMEKEEELVSR
jgi:hypothetical protein